MEEGVKSVAITSRSKLPIVKQTYKSFVVGEGFGLSQFYFNNYLIKGIFPLGQKCRGNKLHSITIKSNLVALLYIQKLSLLISLPLRFLKENFVKYLQVKRQIIKLLSEDHALLNAQKNSRRDCALKLFLKTFLKSSIKNVEFLKVFEECANSVYTYLQSVT